jgi:hypothetical protein
MTQMLCQNQPIVRQPFVSSNVYENDLFYLVQTHLKYKNTLRAILALDHSGDFFINILIQQGFRELCAFLVLFVPIDRNDNFGLKTKILTQ